MGSGYIELPVPAPIQGSQYTSLPVKGALPFTDNVSIKFNGTTSYVDMGNNLALAPRGPMWLGCWIKLTGTHPSTDLGKMDIMGKCMDSMAAPSLEHRGYELRVTNDGSYLNRLCFYITSSFTGTTNTYMGIVSKNYAIPLNQWVRVDVVSTNGTYAGASMYIDNVQVPTDMEKDNLGSASIATNAHFSLGSRNNVENFFPGYINDPIVAAFAPTLADIASVAASTAPTDAAALTYQGGSLLAAWRNGDEDSAPTVLDHIGSANGTLAGGAVFANETQSTVFTAQPGWVPAVGAVDGTLVRFMDSTNGATITQSSGSVSQWTGLDATNSLFAASSHKPIVAGGIVSSDGTQYLTETSTHRTLDPHYNVIIGYKGSIVGFGGGAYPTIMVDGDGVAQNTKLGYSNDVSGHYDNIYFGQATLANGFPHVHWNFGLTTPGNAAGTILWQTIGAIFSYTGIWNGSVRTTNTSGDFSSETDPSALFAGGSANILDGAIKYYVAIVNPSGQDIANLRAFIGN